jgi:hypothetical protein
MICLCGCSAVLQAHVESACAGAALYPIKISSPTISCTAVVWPCIRFFEDQIHDKEVLIEKLTLKNTTFKAAIAKLEAQLAHKEEMGEVST